MNQIPAKAFLQKGKREGNKADRILREVSLDCLGRKERIAKEYHFPPKSFHLQRDLIITKVGHLIPSNLCFHCFQIPPPSHSVHWVVFGFGSVEIGF